MDTTWLENTPSGNQGVTREPSNTIPTRTVSTLMCITETEMTILEAATDDKVAVAVAVAMEDTRVVTAAIVVMLSFMKMIIKATVLCFTGVLLFWHSLELP